MTIATTDEHKAVQESMRSWASAVKPVAALRTGSAGFWREYWPGLVELGIFRVAVPEQAGGVGAAVSDLAVLIEQAAHDLVGGPVTATALAGLVVGDALAEEVPCGIGLGEPVTIRNSESQELSLTGDWDPVLGAEPGTALLLPVRSQGRQRWVLLDPDTDGVRIEALPALDRSTPLARVSCAEVAVAADRVVESPCAVEDLAAALICAELAGIAGWCLDTAVEYAKVREQFGRKIGQFQAVKHICSWMLCRTEMIRAVAADVTAAVDSRSAELPIAAAIALSVALDAAVDTAKDCIQVLGGIGFTWEHDAHLYLRRATALRALLGGSARWRARVAELVRAGQRRTVGLDLSLESASGATDSDPGDRAALFEAIGLDAAGVAELAADVAAIADLPADRQREALVESGLLAPHWPAPYGRGAGPILRTLIDQQLRSAGVTVPDVQIGNWAVPTLLQHGTPEQIERFVRPTLTGETVWCQLFSEPGAGSDLAALRTTATKVDGGWKLNGQKVWTSLAKSATWAICLARTDASVPKHRGISYFLVDMASAGLEVRPLVQITGKAEFSEVFLDEVFVPDDCLVGTPGAGWKIARATLSNERIAMGGSGIGAELEELIEAAPTEGPGSELLTDRIGALVSDAVGGLLLETRAALRMLAGHDPGPPSSVRKLVGVRHRQAVSELGLEVAGRAGSVENHLTQEFLQHRCLSIAGGTEQILLTVAAERILGLPREPQT
ncbi:MAG: acyl-CoA dehydrogenase [Nocardia sp.]|nr:acyl-CoA dehydrogenase [Nocardia sp.]